MSTGRGDRPVTRHSKPGTRSGTIDGMGFFDRNRANLVKQGIDPARLPPGQYTTDRFPVLHVGDIPDYEPGQWDLTIHGLVDEPFTLSFDELAVAAVDHPDLRHPLRHQVEQVRHRRGPACASATCSLSAGVRPEATHVMEHAEFGYTTNIPLVDITTDNAIIAFAYEGGSIPDEHGGPVRVVVPHLYFWKSAKWVRSLELIAGDAPGFWEQNGYHMYGDPFREQRFTND